MLEIISLFILFFLPGYLVLGKRFQDEEKFCLALAFSIVMYAGTAVILHFFNISIIWSLIIFPLSFLTLIFKRPTFNLPLKLLLIFGLTLILETILCRVSKFPTIGDSYWHFLVGKSFLTNDWLILPCPESYWQGIDKAFYVQYRPPLFNLILGLVFSIFGASFQIAQLVVVLFTTSLLSPIYLIGKRLYDEKCAFYSIILLITINSFFLSLTFEVFVYPAGAYFSLCLFYLYLRKHWNYIAVVAALAYLTHPSSIILIFSMILFELWNKRKDIWQRIKSKNISIKLEYLYPICIFILIISPWLLRNYVIFGDPLYTSAKYVPFCKEHLNVGSLVPPTLQDYLNFLFSNPMNFIQAKLGPLFLTFLPRPYSVTFSRWDIQALWDPVKVNWALAGFLTYPLLIVVMYFMVTKARQMIPSLFYLGLMSSLCLVGYRVGYMQSFLLPQSVLLGIWGINIVKNRKVFIFLMILILIWQCVGVLENRYKSKESPTQKLYAWMKNNIGPDEKIMSSNILSITYFTGRGGLGPPTEDMATILSCIEKWSVDYFFVDETDLRLKHIDLRTIEKHYKFFKEIDGTRIYKVK